MTYRELQKALKQLRKQGLVPASFKLNQKKAILQAMWDEVNVTSQPSSFSKVAEVLEWDCSAAIVLCSGISNRALYGEALEAYEDELEIYLEDIQAIWNEPQYKAAKAMLTGAENEEWVNDLLQDVNLHRLVKF